MLQSFCCLKSFILLPRKSVSVLFKIHRLASSKLSQFAAKLQKFRQITKFCPYVLISKYFLCEKCKVKSVKANCRLLHFHFLLCVNLSSKICLISISKRFFGLTPPDVSLEIVKVAPICCQSSKIIYIQFAAKI